MADVELHQLRYFVTVAERRHFTRAARDLRIAQPSVSRAIRVLEEELGTPLFHRMKGNVALTAAGAVPHTHPFAARKTVSIGDLKGAPLVMFRDGYDLRAATLAACRRAGFEPSFALEGAEMDGVLRLAAAGLGVAVVPSLVIDPAGPLRAVRLAEPITRTIGFANRRDRRLSRAGREFVDTVRTLVRGREWLRSRPPGLAVLDKAER